MSQKLFPSAPGKGVRDFAASGRGPFLQGAGCAGVQVVNARNELGIVVAGCVLVGIVHVVLMRDWNPALSCDTHYNYFPTLEVLNDPDSGWMRRFALPFFRPDENRTPLAEEAKPVFVCALRAWHVGYRVVQPCRPGVNAPHAYSDFIIFSSMLAFGALCLLARKLGNLFIGMIAGFLTLLSPWGLETCYFNTYTAFSLVLIFTAAYLALCRPMVCSYLSGALLACCAMTNQSLIGCLIALPLLLGLAHGMHGGLCRRFARIAIFFLGATMPYLALEQFGATEWVRSELRCNHIQTPFTILVYYFIRSATERLEFIDAYHQSHFWNLLNCNSTVTVYFLLGVLLVLTAILSQCGNRIGRLVGWLRSEAAFPALGSGLFAAISLLITDGRPEAVRLARSYFVVLPFLYLSALFLVRSWMPLAPRWLYIVTLAGVALAWTAENTVRLVDFYRAFHSARITLQRSLKGGERIVCLGNDRYNCFLRTMVDLDVVNNDSIPPDVRYIVTGPALPSALEDTRSQKDSNRILYQPHVRLRLKKALPFFALYPFITYEDPFATHQMLVLHVFHHHSYKRTWGCVRIWEVVR
jgi:hypothetical protein